MRALFKKSEFCSDEHAEQYKDQTLDRLLTESEQPAEKVAPLPLPVSANVPLASLESRTPLLEGDTLYGGPRRLTPPKPALSPAGGHAEFGGLLDRLPGKKPAGAPAGNIGGWDQAGGEDPLEALLRLESGPPGGTAAVGPTTSVKVPGFDSQTGAATSNEDDAISALRRLAEEARQSARPKPTPAIENGDGPDDPFARLSTSDWGTPKLTAADDPLLAPGNPGEEPWPADSPFDGLAGQGDESAPESTDGLSIFDRLVRNFDGGTPEETSGDSVSTPTLGSDVDRSAQWGFDAAPGGEESPFAGSEFDRLMADAPRPTPAKPVDALVPARDSLAPVMSSIDGPPEQAEAIATNVEVEPGVSEAAFGEFAESPSAEAVAPEPTVEPLTAEPENARRDPAPAALVKHRKAAPIEPKTELPYLVPVGWPNEDEMSSEPEFVERNFAAQRALEAALCATKPPSPLAPSRVQVPVVEDSPGARFRVFANAASIPWLSELQWAGIPGPVGPLEEVPWEAVPALQGSEPVPVAPRAGLPRVAPAHGHRFERFRTVAIAARVLEINAPNTAAIPAVDVPPPRLECLPANGRHAGPRPRPPGSAASASGGRPICARLGWTDVLPEPKSLVAAPASRPELVALPPRGGARFPGIELPGELVSSNTATLPGVVAGLLGAEPAGCAFDSADPEQMRRLVAEQTSSAVGSNGRSSLDWNQFAPTEPLQPAFNVGNGNRL